MFLNYSARELNIKVVYCGPDLAGKKTSYQYVRSKFPKREGWWHTQSTFVGRTDYFDFVPPGLGEIRGFRSRIHLYVLLEHVASENTRRLMLTGVDGVIFVADSQRQCAEDNLGSLEEMEINLVASGYDPVTLPRAYSYNKRDLPDALPIEEMEKQLNPQRKYPSFETIASRGVGVFDPLKAVVRANLLEATGGSTRGA